MDPRPRKGKFSQIPPQIGMSMQLLRGNWWSFFFDHRWNRMKICRGPFLSVPFGSFDGKRRELVSALVSGVFGKGLGDRSLKMFTSPPAFSGLSNTVFFVHATGDASFFFRWPVQDFGTPFSLDASHRRGVFGGGKGE
ncbi:hypothetical protein JTE90_008881 [Oedothorax gibbosus]|uniref:Uncharacterized protein n=1 Tax=Oedothorax gibbosus TaxID=931172 RepID=A0AAV6TIJ4_9ARAC|nr:hypothetical protein JTE90_008881 [Oedothorax gibbosus]